MDVEPLIRQITRGEPLQERTITKLCDKLKEVMRSEPNVKYVKAPLTVVGNINGQLDDLVELFRVGGPPPHTNYIFLGDIVNRGFFSVETILLLICFKLRFNERITLLRGHQECRKMTLVYGLYSEVLRKYGSAKVWTSLCDLFDFFPITAVIEDSIFCAHSGISDECSTLDQIRILNRIQEIPPTGIIHDLVTSNPHLNSTENGFKRNGNDLCFGFEELKQFLSKNNLSCLVRSNQLCVDGHQTIYNGKLCTIWSAPNFLGRCGNVGAILEISENLEKMHNTYQAVPASERLPTHLSDIKAAPDYFR